METAKNKTDAELTGYSPIDKPWLKYYSEEELDYTIPECKIADNLYKHSKSCK